MKYSNSMIFISAVAFFYSSFNAKAISGPLILSGVDTLVTYNTLGYDFVKQRACTTATNTQECQTHLLQFTCAKWPWRGQKRHFLVPEIDL
jgi:hypothetical protein